MCINFAQQYLRNAYDKTIATRLLYVHTKFEAIWTLLPGIVVVLNPTLYRLHRACERHQNIEK